MSAVRLDSLSESTSPSAPARGIGVRLAWVAELQSTAPCDAVGVCNDEENENNNCKEVELVRKHGVDLTTSNAMQESKTQLWHIIISLGTYGFALTMRQNLYVLYARSEMSTNLDSKEIDRITAGGFLFEQLYAALIRFVYSALANTYGYDLLTVIQFIIV